MKCWHKSPLGPTIMSGCYILAYINSPQEFGKVRSIFGAKVVSIKEVLGLDPEAEDIGKKYAILWCWS